MQYVKCIIMNTKRNQNALGTQCLTKCVISPLSFSSITPIDDIHYIISTTEVTCNGRRTLQRSTTVPPTLINYDLTSTI